MIPEDKVRNRIKIASAVCAISLAGLAVAACGSSTPSSSSTSQSGPSDASNTITMESSPTGVLVRNFNPYTSGAEGNVLGLTDMINEPLMQFDLVKPGVTYPWLATSYQWSNSGKTLTFTLRTGVKYTNGDPFDAADVAFVFNMLKKYPTLNQSGLPIAGATAPNATTAVINFTSAQYAAFYNIANTPMVPEAVWSAIPNPSTYTDPTPIGTGPYVFDTFSSGGVLLKKNPNYWQPGKPQVGYLDFPAYDSNTTANLALENGSLTWGGNFVSDIKTAFLAKSPNYHVWDAPLQTEAIIPNLTVWPWTSLAVRQAVAVGIDRDVISADGEDGQQPPANQPGSLTLLTLPNDASYLTPQTSSPAYTATYSTSEAKSILEKAGFTMHSNGYFYSSSGQEVAFTLTDPSSYTDFDDDNAIMASELKAAGIAVTVQQVSVNAWNSDLADGNFSATSHWGTGGTSPYYDYNGYLNSALTAPIGQTAVGDYERFYSPQADADLAAFAGTTSATAQKAAIVSLEQIVATQLPVIPIFYGVAWDEYNTTHFTGWPGPTDEYDPGEPSGPFNEYTVLQLTPKS
jgi:peptide/nickel transport system substrate-binding protein